MQVPIGVSGVQAVPKTLHSHGFKHALEDLAALARLRVGHPHAGQFEHPLGVEGGVLVADPQRRVGDEPQIPATRRTAVGR